jgi:ABC-type amino acid transport substrate-binding protein
MNRALLPTIAIALGLVLHLTPPIPRAEADEPAVFPDIQRILDAGILRVAMRSKDAPPMIMTAEDGTPAGSEPDIARDLARKLGVEVAFIRTAETYDGVVDVVAGKEADIAVSYLSGGVQRARYVAFSRPYVRQSGRLVYNRARFAELRRDYGVEDLLAIEDIPVASELEVGVIAGSIYETNLERDFPKSRLRRFDNLDELMAAVRSGEIFAALNGGLQLDYFMRRNPATAIYVAIDPDIRQPDDIRIAVRPDAPYLLRWVDLYLANHVGMLEDEEIVQRYLDREQDSERR